MKFTDTELRQINRLSLFLKTPQTDFYEQFFIQLFTEVENVFEPFIEYIYDNKIREYVYEFWLNKEQKLSFKKQDSGDDWNWFVGIEDAHYAYILYSTSKYCRQFDSYGWNEKQMPNGCEVFDAWKERSKTILERLYSAYKCIADDYDNYINNLHAKLISYRRREGVISDKIYNKLDLQYASEYRDRMTAWQSNKANASLFNRCLKYINEPITPIEKVTIRQYFEACKAYYEANACRFQKKTPETAPKDWYLAYADGRDDGLTDV